MTTLRKIDLGTVRYADALCRQRELFDEVVGGAQGALVLVEHPHVYTLGKSGDAGNMLIGEALLEKIGAEFVSTDRGGDITYHGYGQAVIYPIVNISELGISLRRYIFLLEQSIIDAVAEYGIEAGRSDGATGVWVDQNGSVARKIAAIGVRASRSVTMHGAALNVTTDLSYFSHINPCGFVDRGVTSIEKEIGRKIDLSEVGEKFCRHFEMNFKVSLADSLK